MNRLRILRLLLCTALAGCAGTPRQPPVSDATAYRCPDGRRLAIRMGQPYNQTLLAIGGAQHRLSQVADPLGGMLAQDADFQLRPSPDQGSVTLTDRATTEPVTCTRAP